MVRWFDSRRQTNKQRERRNNRARLTAAFHGPDIIEALQLELLYYAPFFLSFSEHCTHRYKESTKIRMKTEIPPSKTSAPEINVFSTSKFRLDVG